MQQQYIMSLEGRMIMRISEVTSINTPGCIEKQQGRLRDEEFDTHNKLHFLSRLRNSTIAHQDKFRVKNSRSLISIL